MKTAFKTVAHASLMVTALALIACDKPDTEKKEAAADTPAGMPIQPSSPPVPVATEAASGTYRLDKSHASLTFKVNHLGFSHYTAQFTDFDATLEGDPKNPATAKLTATVNPKSLSLPTPPAGFVDALLGPDWLDAGKYPEIKFVSTAVELTGPNTARITGDFTLHGATKPLVLDATFNGGYAGHPMDPNSRIGFSATGTLKRSDYGIAYGIPQPGSTMGVSDEVQIAIETEFTGPKLEGAAAPAKH